MLKQGHDGIVLGGLRYFFVIRLILVKALLNVDVDDDDAVDNDEADAPDDDDDITCRSNAGPSNDEHVDNDDDDDISDVEDDVDADSISIFNLCLLIFSHCLKNFCNSMRSMSDIAFISTFFFIGFSGVYVVHSSQILILKNHSIIESF